MKKFILLIVALIIILILFLPVNKKDNNSIYIYPEITLQQDLYEILEISLKNNISEDDPLVRRARKLLEESIKRYEEDRDIIATVVYNEAGYGCSNRHMELVAAVIYNRLQSDLFQNTIYEIVTAPNQYHPLYAESDSFYGKRARESEKWEQCQEIAERALRGEIKCPKTVFYQANFRQGSKVYEKHKTSYSITWFCYG